MFVDSSVSQLAHNGHTYTAKHCITNKDDTIESGHELKKRMSGMAVCHNLQYNTHQVHIALKLTYLDFGDSDFHSRSTTLCAVSMMR